VSDSHPSSAPAPGFVLEIAVQWAEMDVLGHVNNARYFTWFESARIAYFEKVGLVPAGPTGVGPVLAQVSGEFLRPVVYPERVLVSVSVTKLGTTSITMAYEVRSAGAPATLYARGSSVAVTVHYATMQKTPVPRAVRAAIAVMEQKPSIADGP
jgi:acyl-CoA thioester hydrolase